MNLIGFRDFLKLLNCLQPELNKLLCRMQHFIGRKLGHNNRVSRSCENSYLRF